MLIRPDRGATGFWSQRNEPLPKTDVALFRHACAEAARGSQARLGELVPAGMSTFHWLSISDQREVHVVLCHVHLPLVAFTHVLPQPGQPVAGFVDARMWAGGFEGAGLRLLTVQELGTPMDQVDLRSLSKAELAQIRYWRPEVLSDLLFNWWD
ncbi:hypothetical protein [Kitasatospora sp. HPMI-4]|uniref:hypothetical protein n=1 Tax=Kitasatospora sp. HPMI-4 TaxID=3448443 RepID=UPI003F1C8CE3